MSKKDYAFIMAVHTAFSFIKIRKKVLPSDFLYLKAVIIIKKVHNLCCIYLHRDNKYWYYDINDANRFLRIIYFFGGIL